MMVVERSFHQYVFHAGGVGLADRGAGVDLDFEVQAVVSSAGRHSGAAARPGSR